MRDFIEQMEDAAEARYERMLQPDGKLKCDCGKLFDADKEGGPVSPNPYAMPVCGDCFIEYIEAASQDADREMIGDDVDFGLEDIGNK